MKLYFIGYRSNALKNEREFYCFQRQPNHTASIAADTYSIQAVQPCHEIE
jgi:hypothetical protein